MPRGWSPSATGRQAFTAQHIILCEESKICQPHPTQVLLPIPLLHSCSRSDRKCRNRCPLLVAHRTQPEGPPDVQQIQKQMAIVAWQPGPNRYVQVPFQVLQCTHLPATAFFPAVSCSL